LKAIVYENYGAPSVLRLREIEKPAPLEGEVLIRVRAASVNPLDWHFLTGRPLVVRMFAGLLRPKHPILGADISGSIEAVGSGVRTLHAGDDVFGTTGASGSFAEYAAIREGRLTRKPANVGFDEAAAAPVAALTALQGLRDKGGLRGGQRVLILGASGGVGTYAVQIAKSFGAHVTGVCSGRNVDLVRCLGADRVLGYDRDDFARESATYDVILDLVGKRSLADCKRALAEAGVYIAIAGAPSRTLWMSLTGGKRMVSMITRPNQADLGIVRDLLESGKIRSVIDRRYPLSGAADAVQYVGEKHSRGKVVLTIPSG
jgi:NADPH:quinone reductase-like Zn-dependent oxidoreductase